MTIQELTVFIILTSIYAIPSLLWFFTMKPFIRTFHANEAHAANWFISQMVDYQTIGQICKEKSIRRPIGSLLWLVFILAWLPGIALVTTII